MDNEELQLELDLQGFTYADRPSLLPLLAQSIDTAGGWVLERRPVSSAAMEVFLEVQACALPEVYAALLSSGVELTRDAHRTLAERCNCSLHLRPRGGISSILMLRIEIHFLIDSPQTPDFARLMQMGTAAA